MNHLDIMKLCYENERQRLISKAQELARELASSAEMIAKAAVEGDLPRIAWLTRALDVELATRATVLHDNLRMLAGFDNHESRVFCQGCQQRIPYGPTSKDIERYEKRLCGACEEMRAREKAGNH